MPPPINNHSAPVTESLKPLFNPDFSSKHESHQTSANDSQDSSSFALKNTQEASLKKIENNRSHAQDPLDDFLKKQQDEDKPYVLSPTPGNTIPVNPYVHQPHIEEFVETFQAPLVNSDSMQKGIHLLAKTQPATLMLDQLSDQLDSQKINNPIKPLREGFEQGIAETLSSFTSPQNITLASATLMLSVTPAEPYLGAAFTTALVPAVANSAKQTVDAVAQGNLKEVGRHAAHTMIGGVGLWVSAKGYLEEPSLTSSQKPVELAPALKSKEIINTELLPLEAHEAAGGHLIAKHVGKTESELRARLAAEPNLQVASSFFDQQTAQTSSNKLITKHKEEIQNWLQGDSKQLIINDKLTSPIGFGIIRNSAKKVELSSVRLLLRRDTNLPAGYKIHTGYPIP